VTGVGADGLGESLQALLKGLLDEEVEDESLDLLAGEVEVLFELLWRRGLLPVRQHACYSLLSAEGLFRVSGHYFTGSPLPTETAAIGAAATSFFANFIRRNWIRDFCESGLSETVPSSNVTTRTSPSLPEREHVTLDSNAWIALARVIRDEGVTRPRPPQDYPLGAGGGPWEQRGIGAASNVCYV